MGVCTARLVISGVRHSAADHRPTQQGHLSRGTHPSMGNADVHETMRMSVAGMDISRCELFGLVLMTTWHLFGRSAFLSVIL